MYYKKSLFFETVFWNRKSVLYLLKPFQYFIFIEKKVQFVHFVKYLVYFTAGNGRINWNSNKNKLYFFSDPQKWKSPGFKRYLWILVRKSLNLRNQKRKMKIKRKKSKDRCKIQLKKINEIYCFWIALYFCCCCYFDRKLQAEDTIV